MQFTLLDVLSDVGATVDQDVATPDSTELLNRVQFVNRSQADWSNAYKWKDLNKQLAPTVLNSMVSLGLPDNFRDLSGPVYDNSISADNKYIEIDPDQKVLKLPTDKYVIRRGDQVQGQWLEISPALASGVSLLIDYTSYPSSVATLTDKLTCPSREFMAKRTAYYILEARSDSRFPLIYQQSEDLLRSLITEQDSPNQGEQNRVPDWMRKTGFRIGR